MPWAVGTRYDSLGVMSLTCDESVVNGSVTTVTSRLTSLDMINMPAVKAHAR